MMKTLRLSLTISLFLLAALSCTSAGADSAYEVTTTNSSATLFSGGGIVSLQYGTSKRERSLQGVLQMLNCRVTGNVVVESTADKGLSFTRRWVSDKHGNECIAIERFIPAGQSIRWGCAIVQIKNDDRASTGTGTRIVPLLEPRQYADNRPAARYQIHVQDHGIVLKHGTEPAGCDSLGARDIWVWEDAGTYFMHYDGAGPTGWLACLATSRNLTEWTTHGPILPLGDANHQDRASASYGVTYNDGKKWHMFYLGTPHTSPAPDLVPAFPYLTMKAEGTSPTGPWTKRYDIVPFSPKPGTYYSATASPGQIIRQKREYLMFYSASTDSPILRTVAIARTGNLDGPWKIDPKPILPPAEQVENTSLYYQESSKTWFLFTNHVGLRDGLEYTDAIWVYWTEDLEQWDPDHKAVVLDGSTSTWSKEIIGLPSVVKHGDKLALFYDGYAGHGIPPGASSHMNRDVGLAWIGLPIIAPNQE